jgi:hypothetical protein
MIRGEPGGPAGYRFDKDFPETKLAGDWQGAGDDGAVGFTDGPLGGATADEPPAGTTMPDDQVPGRTWPLLVEGADDVRWYCRSTVVNPRSEFRGDASWVRQRTGLAIRLPNAVDQGSLSFTLDGAPFSSVQTRVRVAAKGLWRLELLNGPCSGEDCGSMAIFSAKRAPARRLISQPKVKLASGIVGRAGSVGCGPHPGPANWGPVYCGRNVIVWHQGKVNYAIESVGAGVGELKRYANQAISYRS